MVGLLSHIASKIKKLVHWQLFKKNEGNCEDMGPGIMNRERLRDEKFQRHAGNILVSRQGEEGRILLTPIDHGYCLPENVYTVEEPDSASVSESNRVDNITDDEYLSYKTSSEESDDSAACETLIQVNTKARKSLVTI
ncbi:hypothetical protein P3L10_015962 [Capsicum annuum]